MRRSLYAIIMLITKLPEVITPVRSIPRRVECDLNLAFLNAPILAYATEIRSAVMVVHGEKAHSRYMGEDAFKKLQGDNKRLLIVPGANHTDLYDKMEIIPFDEIAAFYREYLK